MAVHLSFLLAAASLWAGEQDSRNQPRKVAIDGVELNYIESGTGIPVVFVHGTLGDYSVWEGQLGPFATNYHALAYSRRYNYPNVNTPQSKHCAVVEAEDLAMFIKKLNLGKVHVVGHSYGGFAGRFLAVKHPELVIGYRRDISGSMMTNRIMTAQECSDMERRLGRREGGRARGACFQTFLPSRLPNSSWFPA
jgi:hypothetical protein